MVINVSRCPRVALTILAKAEAGFEPAKVSQRICNPLH